MHGAVGMRNSIYCYIHVVSTYSDFRVSFNSACMSNNRVRVGVVWNEG